MEIRREGRVWKFGDDVNTDLIFPNRAFREPLAAQHRFVFSANRPGWIDAVQPGDLIVAGQNFGMGSGRPVGRLVLPVARGWAWGVWCMWGAWPSGCGVSGVCGMCVCAWCVSRHETETRAASHARARHAPHNL